MISTLQWEHRNMGQKLVLFYLSTSSTNRMASFMHFSQTACFKFRRRNSSCPSSERKSQFMSDRHSVLPFICENCCSNRSEERRVGKECRSRWSRYHSK